MADRRAAALKEMRGEPVNDSERALNDETARWGSDQLASDLRVYRDGGKPSGQG